MKTVPTPNGLLVQETCEALDVVYAGIAGLVNYYDEVNPNGPYMMRAFAMCQYYCSMVQDIHHRRQIHVYNTHILAMLDRLKAATDEKEGKSDGPAEEAPPVAEG